MPRVLWSVIMLAALAVCGCNSSDQPAPQSATVEKRSNDVESPPSADLSKAASPATAAPVSEPAEQAKANAKQDAEPSPAVSGAASAEPGTPATSTAGVEGKPAEAMANEAAKQADAAAAPASPPEVARQAVTEAAIPDVIVLKASNGDVAFPHRAHAETHECQTCHGDGTPAAFGINKEIAHKLCKDCHKTVGAGPTACNGCHKK